MGEEKPLTGGVPRASDWYESRRVSALAAGERGGAVESNQVTAHAGGGGPGLSLHGEPGGGGAVRRSSHGPPEHPCLALPWPVCAPGATGLGAHPPFASVPKTSLSPPAFPVQWRCPQVSLWDEGLEPGCFLRGAAKAMPSWGSLTVPWAQPNISRMRGQRTPRCCHSLSPLIVQYYTNTVSCPAHKWKHRRPS